MKKIQYFILSVLCFTSIMVCAQDIHFSQFYMSPLNLNPAMTGTSNVKARAIANYRNQWAGALGTNAYNTFSVSYDQKLPTGRKDYMGIGGVLWHDVAGESRFGTSQLKASFSYSKNMGGYRKKAHYLVGGADVGLTQRRISIKDLRWPNQFDAKGYDRNKDSGETFDNTSVLYPDVSLGLLWYSLLSENTSWYAGLSIHHINRPVVSFYGNSEARLYMKFAVNGGGQLRITNDMSVLPFFVFFNQGPHKQLNTGASVRFRLGKYRTVKQSWQVGSYIRLGNKVDGGLHSDAIIFSTRFNFENYSVGFSYDWTISKLSNAGNANGSFELSLKYDIFGDEIRGIYSPQF